MRASIRLSLESLSRTKKVFLLTYIIVPIIQTVLLMIHFFCGLTLTCLENLKPTLSQIMES